MRLDMWSRLQRRMDAALVALWICRVDVRIARGVTLECGRCMPNQALDAVTNATRRECAGERVPPYTVHELPKTQVLDFPLE